MLLDALWERRATKTTGGDPRTAQYWVQKLFGATKNLSGVEVDENTAMTLPAVFRAVDLLSSHLAMLPLPIIRKRDDGTREHVRAHPLNTLLNLEPNPKMSAFSFRRTLHLHTTLRGNGYAEVVRREAGIVARLTLIPGWPTKIETLDDDTLRYRFRVDGGMMRELPGENVLHPAGIGADGIQGYPLIDRLARDNIGLGLAISRYAEAFFGNSTVLGTIFSTPNKFDAEQREANLQAIIAGRGGPAGSYKPIMLDGGLEAKKLNSTNEASQTLELMTFSVQDIARWFNIPPPMLMELSRATFSNISEQGLWYVKYTLAPWLVMYEQEFGRKLFTAAEKPTHQFKFNVDALLRGDLPARYEAYAQGINTGFLSPDEAREKEDLNARLDGRGGMFWEPVNMNVGGQPVDEDMQDEDSRSATLIAERDRIVEAFRPIFQQAFLRLAHAEEKHFQSLVRKRGDDAGVKDLVITFYAKHRTMVGDMLRPALVGLARALDRPIDVDGLCDRYIRDTRDAVVASASTATEIPNVWNEKRTTDIAEAALCAVAGLNGEYHGNRN